MVPAAPLARARADIIPPYTALEVIGGHETNITEPSGTESIWSMVNIFWGYSSQKTYIMSRMGRCRIMYWHILDCVGGTNNLDRPFLTLWRPHSEPWKESSVAVAELAESIAHITTI
jgi:hypothetical protein